MSVKEITGLLTILPEKDGSNQAVKEELQAGNIAFRGVARRRTLEMWNNNSGFTGATIKSYPFKQGGLLTDDDLTVGHSLWSLANLTSYPEAIASSPISMGPAGLDYTKFRATGSVGTVPSTDESRVHAGIAAYDTLSSTIEFALWGNSVIAASDIPVDYTQIGTVYAHPMYLVSTGGTAPNTALTTVAGQNYVTFANAPGWWDNGYITPTRFGVVRIASGADAGFYYVQHLDFSANNRLYLRNLNGTPFVAQASATIAGTDIYVGPGRTTYFNEVSIIPLSTGEVVTGGRFRPDPLTVRSSFILKVKIEKTGSTAVAAGTEQQGSYFIGLRPYTHGEYDQGYGYEFAMFRQTTNGGVGSLAHNFVTAASSGVGGGVNGFALNEADQRLWAGYTDTVNSQTAIMHWRWRTLESPREVANHLGTAAHASFLTPALVLGAGDRIRGATVGSDKRVYFAIGHATLGNGGLIVIKPDLTTLQYTENLGGAAWTGTGDTIGGTAPNMTLTDATALFNASHVGRSITISGATGNNNGTFLITGYTSPTVITYRNYQGTGETIGLTWTILGVPDSNVAGVVADKTRTRTFSAIDTTAGALAAFQVIEDTSGTTFLAEDLGRVFRVISGADAGLYKISSVVDNNTIQVTTVTGGSLAFTGSTAQTGEIGDRLYMFYNNGTTGDDLINYMEALVPGTFMTRAVTMTNAINCNIQNQNGENQKISIDPASGDVYWLSNDVQQQINKYDVSANSHSFIAISDTALTNPPGGVPVGQSSTYITTTMAPTFFNAIHVNSKFDEIWVGSDDGHFKIPKSTFAVASAKRYWGAEQTPYAAGTPLTTSTGGGTGIAGSNPTWNLTSSGTPFVATDKGKFVVITGSSSAGNNGYFPITAVNSSSNITYTNASGTAQAGYTGTFYIVSSIHLRSGGNNTSASNSDIVRNYWEHPDGRIQTSMWGNTTASHDFAYYSREADSFTYRVSIINQPSGTQAGGRNKVFDSIGWFLDMGPSANSSGSKVWFGSVEVNYQWTGSVWTPKEVGYAGTPNKSFADTTNPNCAAKPIHAGLEDTLYGVKIGFTPQGGATPPNNEFLGRMGQTRTTTSDGATAAAGTNTFDGTSFVSGDVGRLLRIETGAAAGLYKIITQTVSQLTLKNMDGTAFSSPGVEGSLTYTIWDFGSVGSNAGPEEMTVMLADGVGKDNTQDITGFTYENYHFKTVLHENDESRKFMVENPLAVPGSIATKVYFENYARATRQYDPATSNHLALPGSEYANGRQALDGIMGKILNGTGAKGTMVSSPSNANIWHGILHNTVLGYSLMVDFGVDVQVGYAVCRSYNATNAHRLATTNSFNGMLANVYKANSAGGTPVASSVTRTSGTTNLSFAANGTTGTLSSGNFLGPTTLTFGIGGAIVTGQSTFSDITNTPFLSSHVGQILQIGAGGGADIGSYRIIGFTSSSVVTIRNLDQTAKTWTVSSSVAYIVSDGVREEDKLVFTATNAHRLLVERLLSPTTLQVRTACSEIATNVSWDCVKPTWDLVKRISFSTEAVPPEVRDNGTFLCHDGRESTDDSDAKIYTDFSDLPAANRTGRWWKLVAQPRFEANQTDTTHHLSTWEFYDTTGKRLATSKYTMVDESRTNLDYFFNHINRFDVVQAANDAIGSGTFNGLVNLVDGIFPLLGNTLTLAGGGPHRFLGFQIGLTITDGGLPVGTNQINSAGSNWPASAMPGRFIQILEGTNIGNFYRVLARPSATQITVTTPSGSSVSWAGTESNIDFTVHEGINVGGTSPDKFTFLEDGKEFTLATINDALTTLTFSETNQPLRSNKTWEIRRPGYDTASTTTEATKTARLTRPQSTYPVQSGDLCHDSRGTYRFFSEDIGTGFQRTDGAMAGASGVMTGSGFSKDDEGRLLYVTTGANLGIYEIQTFTNSTTITVRNHYTGGTVTFATDVGPVTYQIYGDRRFRLTRFVVGLRA